MSVYHMCAYASGGQKKALDLLELELYIDGWEKFSSLFSLVQKQPTILLIFYL